MNQTHYLYASNSLIDMLINDLNYLIRYDVKLNKHCTSPQDLVEYVTASAQACRFRNEYTSNDIYMESESNGLDLYSKNRNNISLFKVTDL
jgi:hypothetical protein